MGEAQPLFDVLRQSADVDAVAAIETLIADGRDRDLSRINLLDFAAKRGLEEEKVIAAFLHAAHRPLRVVVERAVPRLRRRARRQRDAEERPQ
jgi:hypothetical protein